MLSKDINFIFFLPKKIRFLSIAKYKNIPLVELKLASIQPPGSKNLPEQFVLLLVVVVVVVVRQTAAKLLTGRLHTA